MDQYPIGGRRLDEWQGPVVGLPAGNDDMQGVSGSQAQSRMDCMPCPFRMGQNLVAVGVHLVEMIFEVLKDQVETVELAFGDV